MKKLLATILALVMALSLCTVAFAAETELSDAAGLKAAIDAAQDGDTIKLMVDVTPSEVIKISDGRSITIDMNGKNINSSSYIEVDHGSLTLSGTGTYTTSSPYALKAVGAATDQGAGYSVITVKKGITVTCTNTAYGYAVMQSPSETGVADTPENERYYGVEINFFGSTNGAIYTNGRCNKTTGSVTKVDLTGAVIGADNTKAGIYAAGYAEWTLKDTTITGGTALSVKSGTFVIDGGTYTANGAYAVPGSDDGNSAVLTGAALSMTSNKGYANKLDVTIKNGKFVSQNGNAICEGIPNKTSGGGTVADESYATLRIENGTFEGNSTNGGAVDLRTMENKEVVSGGTFSNSVDLTYLADGLKYEVYAGGKYSYFTNINDAVAAATEDDIVEDFRSPRGDGEDGYTVRLEDNNAVVARIHSFATSVSLPTLSKSGYTFKGWKDAEGKTYTSQYNIPTASNGEIIPPVSDAYVLTAVWSSNSYYYYSPTSDTTTSTTTKGSPKTFDAGVGIYAVTAVLSVTGMAWAGKSGTKSTKKKARTGFLFCFTGRQKSGRPQAVAFLIMISFSIRSIFSICPFTTVGMPMISVNTSCPSFCVTDATFLHTGCRSAVHTVERHIVYSSPFRIRRASASFSLPTVRSTTASCSSCAASPSTLWASSCSSSAWCWLCVTMYASSATVSSGEWCSCVCP